MSVVAIGELVVDWLCLQATTDFGQAKTFERCLGGNASNVAIGLSRLGHKAYLVGKVGDDLHGRYLKDVLRAESVDETFIVTDAHYPTAQCYVLTGENGEQLYYNWPQPHAADMLSPQEVPAAAIKRAGILHATGISLMREPRRQAVLSALEKARLEGRIVSFDACFPTGHGQDEKKPLKQALALGHILKFNHDEIMFWSQDSGAATAEAAARHIFALYAPLCLAVTLGAAGAFILTRAGEARLPAFAVEPVNSVGAGDAFVAGLLSSLADALPGQLSPASLAALGLDTWRQAALVGSALGAMATLCLNAWQALPDRARLAEFLASQSL